MPVMRILAELLVDPSGAALVLDGASARLVIATEQFIDPTPVEPLPTRLDDYLSLVPPYNRVQPKFIATLSAALQPLCDLQSMLDVMPQQFDLDTAVGVQLDQVGLWIGRDRFVQVPILNVYFSWDIEGLGWEQGFWQGAFDPDQGISKLDDNTYRILLYAKAAANGWDGSFEEMVVILNTLLRGQNLTTLITDNEDMTVDVNISGVLTDLVFTAILQGGYLPIKPEGVKVNYTLPAPTGPQQIGAFSNLHGAGALSVEAVRLWAATATLGASGGLLGDSTVPAGQLIAASAAMAAVGNLGPAARARVLGKITLAGAGTVSAAATVQNPHLLFSDDFTTLSLRNTRNLAAGGTWQPARWYSPDDDGFPVNSGWMVNPFNPATPITSLYTQSGSNLILGLDNTPSAYFTACGSEPFVSSQLHTAPTFSRTTGYWECRAAVPNTIGTGFAFWLTVDGQWPPEIDITETVVLQDGSEFSTQTLWNGDPNAPAIAGTNYSYDMASPPDLTQMHTYGCEVTASTVTFYIDRIQTGTYTKPAGYTSPLFMLLSYEAGDPTWQGNPDSGAMPSQVQVDYVKVWSVRPF